MKTSNQPFWFTSANLQYLDRAALLAESMKDIHPEWESVLVLVDEFPRNNKGFDDLTKCFDLIITPAELLAPTVDSFNIEDWLYSLTVVEACTAVKPFAFAYLAQLNRPIFYFDPDIVVFSSMAEVLEDLTDQSSIAVTPHLLAPSNDFQSILDNEVGTLRYGMFNFGFLAVDPRKENAVKFIEFWKERLKRFCTEKTDEHVFTDQKWGNFLPSFYDDLKILRHPGMNVANWNIENRHISFNSAGELAVNNEPLVFYHFSKANSAGQIMTERYAKGNETVAELWRWYLRELAIKEKLVSSRTWKYSAQSANPLK